METQQRYVIQPKIIKQLNNVKDVKTCFLYLVKVLDYLWQQP